MIRPTYHPQWSIDHHPDGLSQKINNPTGWWPMEKKKVTSPKKAKGQLLRHNRQDAIMSAVLKLSPKNIHATIMAGDHPSPVLLPKKCPVTSQEGDPQKAPPRPAPSFFEKKHEKTPLIKGWLKLPQEKRAFFGFFLNGNRRLFFAFFRGRPYRNIEFNALFSAFFKTSNVNSRVGAFFPDTLLRAKIHEKTSKKACFWALFCVWKVCLIENRVSLCEECTFWEKIDFF